MIEGKIDRYCTFCDVLSSVQDEHQPASLQTYLEDLEDLKHLKFTKVLMESFQVPHHSNMVIQELNSTQINTIGYTIETLDWTCKSKG